jgi:hypothetical protein
VHLVGSVPLDNAAAVFCAASDALGDQLRRIPDGETGERTNWIGWQRQVMARNPSLEMGPVVPALYAPRARFKVRDGVSAGDIHFDNLGYADAAIASYVVFQSLKTDGAIPADVKFMVSLPTPLAPITSFVVLESQALVEPAYESRMLEELAQICVAIPDDQLAIQWDIAVEFGVLEGVMSVHFPNVRDGIVERIVRLSNAVPTNVELGYHLCYGDAGHTHFKQPVDAAKLVDVANSVSLRVQRMIQWLHLPVPIDRFDDAYYEPLRQLRLHPETELYLGLIHLADGLEGSRERASVASRHVGQFGVATECGFGRRPPETVPALLEIHAALSPHRSLPLTPSPWEGEPSPNSGRGVTR